MSVRMQESLLDLGSEPAFGALGDTVRRTPLSRGAWVDFRPGWLSGSGPVFDRLAETVPWRAEKRHMYDRVVDVPRLTCFYEEDAALPDPVLSMAMQALSAHYEPELGEPFRTAGLCLYRDGRDSVAWHGDTTGRSRDEDTMVAIVSLGSPRAFLLRPRGGGRSRRYEIGHGDLLVMGGSCQRTWEHAVPKTAREVGPRISVQFRPHGVRLLPAPAPAGDRRQREALRARLAPSGSRRSVYTARVAGYHDGLADIRAAQAGHG